ncbi:MAG: hypothetical protein ACI9U2_005116 [Bradymonadia bacterium]|jgi:hypothetical protein
MRVLDSISVGKVWVGIVSGRDVFGRSVSGRSVSAVAVVGFALLGAAILPACGEGSKVRACQPVEQTGCSASQTCGLEPDGTPICFDIGPGTEGAGCDTQADCGADLGCLRVHGVARCLRFCTPGEDPADACAGGSELAGAHPDSAAAVCLGTVIGRADIGVCVLPCTPTAAACPDGAACGLIVEAGIAACRPVGAQADGETCDPGRLCDAGLGCVPYADRYVCRPFKTDADCAETTSALVVAGFVNQVDGTELIVCANCVGLGRVGEEGLQITACKAPVSAAESCLSERATRLILEDVADAERVDASARSAAGVVEPWWTGAVRNGLRWAWLDGTAIPAELAPVGAGRCAVWDVGVHRARTCSETAAAICALAPIDAPE